MSSTVCPISAMCPIDGAPVMHVLAPDCKTSVES